MPKRSLCVLAAALLVGCGGGGAPKTDAQAVTDVLKSAAKAVADRDGDKACGYLTADAQRQAMLQTGANALGGDVDCPTFVNRATAFLSPIDKKQIGSLEPANLTVNGAAASATMAGSTGGAAPMSVQLNLQKVGSDWKISGFQNAQGLPGG